MASVGPNNPTAASSDNANGGTLTWVDPTNCFANDGSRVTLAAISLNQVTKLLHASGFGFSIPSGATIDGIKVEVDRGKNLAAPTIVDWDARVYKAGVIAGDDKATSTVIPQPDTYITFGGSTDLWGTTWTPAQINASNFGFGWAAKKQQQEQVSRE